MQESTTPVTPYEVLGVTPAVSMDELRRAYRRRLRETHPDTGGDALAFNAVQVAWSQIGTPRDRAEFDNAFTSGSARGSAANYAAPTTSSPPPAPSSAGAASGFSGTTGSFPEESARTSPTSGSPYGEAAQPSARHAETAPTARAHGHPGGWNREEYFALMREWVGRGARIENPYDEAMVRAAPREIRHLLADANAEEESARTLSHLGIEFTIWHDVSSDLPGPGSEQKLDHIVLGPTGVFGLLSEDWGGALQVRKGEIVSDMLGVGERPMASLAKRIKGLSRSARVKFTALAIVVPDGSTAESMAIIGRERGVPTVIVQKSRLHEFIELGLAGVPRLSADEIFAIRSRLQQVIRFI